MKDYSMSHTGTFPHLHYKVALKGVTIYDDDYSVPYRGTSKIGELVCLRMRRKEDFLQTGCHHHVCKKCWGETLPGEWKGDPTLKGDECVCVSK